MCFAAGHWGSKQMNVEEILPELCSEVDLSLQKMERHLCEVESSFARIGPGYKPLASLAGTAALGEVLVWEASYR
jgi:hypothetical protein